MRYSVLCLGTTALFGLLASAQLYPQEPLGVAYSDMPAECAGWCAAFQELFAPCQSLTTDPKSIIAGPDASSAALAACVCQDDISAAMSTCYECIKADVGNYTLSSTSYTSIYVTALNYDRLCGTSVEEYVPSTRSAGSLSIASGSSTSRSIFSTTRPGATATVDSSTTSAPTAGLAVTSSPLSTSASAAASPPVGDDSGASSLSAGGVTVLTLLAAAVL
ncbi:hypothetical protein JCM10207_002846 [Rhodosporidiobolus poonsookiae]